MLRFVALLQSSHTHKTNHRTQCNWCWDDVVNLIFVEIALLCSLLCFTARCVSSCLIFVLFHCVRTCLFQFFKLSDYLILNTCQASVSLWKRIHWSSTVTFLMTLLSWSQLYKYVLLIDCLQWRTRLHHFKHLQEFFVLFIISFLFRVFHNDFTKNRTFSPIIIIINNTYFTTS